MTKNDSGGDFPVRVDFERILDTIASRIYDNQYAFLRENLQNAIDAVRIQAQRDDRPPSDSSYRISVDVTPTECHIIDNGIGMTREELISNFWTMGASGKNTDEARRAGCIGTFGIGGFANFGVCETLEVTSRSEQSPLSFKTSLSRSAFKSTPSLPVVRCEQSAELTSRGTIVHGIAQNPFDVNSLLTYIRPFVRYVAEAVYFNGELISGEVHSMSRENHTPLGVSEEREGVSFSLYCDSDATVSATIRRAVVRKQVYDCSGLVRFLHGSIDVYKRGFLLCATSISSRIGISGWIDCDYLRPTAGRDSLEANSVSILVSLFQTIESAVYDVIVEDPDLLSGNIRILPDLVRRGQIAKLDKLCVELSNGHRMLLGEIRSIASNERRIYYTSSGANTSTTEVLSARGHLIVKLSGSRDRRQVEIQYLKSFCFGQELDGLIECLTLYERPDSYELSVLSEIDFAIRKLFNPKPYRLIAGRLTLDAPIYWSGKEDNGSIMVFVDTKHGELQKLRALGFNSFFWSMIETFCREYLGDTLKRQSVKLFGAGAMDLEDFSRANSELWELVMDDMDVSHVGGMTSSLLHAQGKTELVRQADIARVTISNTGGITISSAQEVEPRRLAKLLNIVDETGTTGLGGHYLRIPENAAAAFGPTIKEFQFLAVVWFANRVTWQLSDAKAMAFVLDVTLDTFVGSSSNDQSSHGSLALSRSNLQEHAGQLYLLIPTIMHSCIVPQGPFDVIRIRIRNELIDLNRPRTWTAKEQINT